MNFGIAKFFGATDKRFQDKYNYLIDLISKNDVSLLDRFYSVGTIYERNDDINPGTIMGGTWVPFGEGQFLVGIDSTQTEFDTLGETGGEKTHLLLSSESGVPAHAHGSREIRVGGTGGPSYDGLQYNDNALNNWGTWNTNNNTAANASSAHNNLPPYRVVYRWVRIA